MIEVEVGSEVNILDDVKEIYPICGLSGKYRNEKGIHEIRNT